MASRGFIKENHYRMQRPSAEINRTYTCSVLEVIRSQVAYICNT